MKTLRLMFLFLPLVFCCSCITYRGVRPESGSDVSTFWSWDGLKIADSLQPTLKWRPAQNPGAAFDVVVYRGIVRMLGEKVVLAPGRRVYYREALRTTSHKLDVPLDGNTIYLWAVRERSNGHVGAWSTWETRGLFGRGGDWGQLFRFETPRK